MNGFKESILNTSSEPGVYLMKNIQGEVIYVGKAGNLKKRLSSYMKRPNSRSGDVKTSVMITKTASVETIVTKTEKEAFILESNLIKKHRPRYNVILKDDKNYLFLCLDINNPYPNLFKVRKPQKNGLLYFGPFASAGAVNETLKVIKKTFKLRKCTGKFFSRRTRPCLHYQMDSCLGPCCLNVDKDRYDAIVKEVVLFLKGRTPKLIQNIEQEMKEAAEARRFEQAAALRDKMFALKKTLEKQVAVTTDFKDRDVIALAGDGRIMVITLLYVRGGYLLGTRHFPFQKSILSDREVMSAFIKQYYDGHAFIPMEILPSVKPDDQDLLEDYLSRCRGKKVSIHTPQRGEKARLLRLAAQNAEDRLKHMSESAASDEALLLRLKNRLAMKTVPRRIECFDNSVLSGTEAVSGMVVFINGRPETSLYRQYKIKNSGTGNDYAMMAEALKRRYGNKDRSDPIPDLLIVDGGKGQLNTALSIINDLQSDVDFPIIGLAKKDEKKGELWDKVYLPGRSNPVLMGSDRELLFFLQRIRDEAHRFALSFHRRRRTKRSLKSALDDIPGIGRKRKTLLFDHFKSMKKIREATVEELSAAPGLNRTLARAIHEALKKG